MPCPGTNPEEGFCDESIKLAKMGKEFLTMARTGDHFSAGKVINVWNRQMEQTGRCDYPPFELNAYEKAMEKSRRNTFAVQ